MRGAVNWRRCFSDFKRVVDLLDDERPARPSLARHPHRASEKKQRARQDKSERGIIWQIGAEMLNADDEARAHARIDPPGGFRMPR